MNVGTLTGVVGHAWGSVLDCTCRGGRPTPSAFARWMGGSQATIGLNQHRFSE